MKIINIANVPAKCPAPRVVPVTFHNRLFCCCSTQITLFSAKTSAIGSSFQKRVVERDWKQWVDVKREKRRLFYALPPVWNVLLLCAGHKSGRKFRVRRNAENSNAK